MACGQAPAGVSRRKWQRKSAHLALARTPPHARGEAAGLVPPRPISVLRASGRHCPPANRLRHSRSSPACPPAQPLASAARARMGCLHTQGCHGNGADETDHLARRQRVVGVDRLRAPSRHPGRLRRPWTPADNALCVRLRGAPPHARGSAVRCESTARCAISHPCCPRTELCAEAAPLGCTEALCCAPTPRQLDPRRPAAPRAVHREAVLWELASVMQRAARRAPLRRSLKHTTSMSSRPSPGDTLPHARAARARRRLTAWGTAVCGAGIAAECDSARILPPCRSFPVGKVRTFFSRLVLNINCCSVLY